MININTCKVGTVFVKASSNEELAKKQKAKVAEEPKVKESEKSTLRKS